MTRGKCLEGIPNPLLYTLYFTLVVLKKVHCHSNIPHFGKTQLRRYTTSGDRKAMLTVLVDIT